MSGHLTTWVEIFFQEIKDMGTDMQNTVSVTILHRLLVWFVYIQTNMICLINSLQHIDCYLNFIRMRLRLGSRLIPSVRLEFVTIVDIYFL